MAEHQLPKLTVRVRFPSPAPRRILMHQATPGAPVITAFHLSSTCNWCRHTCNQPVRRRVRRDDHLAYDGFHRRLRPRLPPTRPDHSTSPLRPRPRSLGHIGDARGRRPYRIRLHGVHEQSSAAPNRPPRRRRRRGVLLLATFVILGAFSPWKARRSPSPQHCCSLGFLGTTDRRRPDGINPSS
jgi:hypothetical protein